MPASALVQVIAVLALSLAWPSPSAHGAPRFTEAYSIVEDTSEDGQHRRFMLYAHDPVLNNGREIEASPSFRTIMPVLGASASTYDIGKDLIKRALVLAKDDGAPGAALMQTAQTAFLWNIALSRPANTPVKPVVQATGLRHVNAIAQVDHGRALILSYDGSMHPRLHLVDENGAMRQVYDGKSGNRAFPLDVVSDMRVVSVRSRWPLRAVIALTTFSSGYHLVDFDESTGAAVDLGSLDFRKVADSTLSSARSLHLDGDNAFIVFISWDRYTPLKAFMVSGLQIKRSIVLSGLLGPHEGGEFRGMPLYDPDQQPGTGYEILGLHVPPDGDPLVYARINGHLKSLALHPQASVPTVQDVRDGTYAQGPVPANRPHSFTDLWEGDLIAVVPTWPEVTAGAPGHSSTAAPLPAETTPGYWRDLFALEFPAGLPPHATVGQFAMAVQATLNFRYALSDLAPQEQAQLGIEVRPLGVRALAPAASADAELAYRLLALREHAKHCAGQMR